MVDAALSNRDSNRLTNADSDDQVIAMWLAGLAENTQMAYATDLRQFRDFLAFKPLRSLTLEDVQSYLAELQARSLTDRTRRRKINAIKSLYSFATRLGYTQFNVTNVVRLPSVPNTLAGKLMRPGETKSLLAVKTTARAAIRNQLFVTMLYATGARISELCALTWADFVERHDGQVQVGIFGKKGGETRQILLPGTIWDQLRSLRANDTPRTNLVFGFKRVQGYLIVKAAVTAAEANPDISPHWMRHAHAFDALKNGAPLQLVRDGLGHSSIAVTNWYLEALPDDSSSNYLGFS